MFLSIPLRKFYCKDNAYVGQKLSTAILFNLKLLADFAKLFHNPPEIFTPDAGRWGGGDGAAVGRKKGLISLSAN